MHQAPSFLTVSLRLVPIVLLFASCLVVFSIWVTCEHALTFLSLRTISYPSLCSSFSSFIRTSYSRD